MNFMMPMVLGCRVSPFPGWRQGRNKEMRLPRSAGLSSFRATAGGAAPGVLMPQATAIGYDSKGEGEVIVTRLDAALNWCRKNSLWPMPMGLACCAIELMASGASRYDIARFGAEVMRFSPRQSDVMIVSGTVTYKMATVVRHLYDQMTEPKWVIAMGAYAVLQGVDRILPVDVYVAGCPPRPEALLDALMGLQAKVARQPIANQLVLTSRPQDTEAVA